MASDDFKRQFEEKLNDLPDKKQQLLSQSEHDFIVKYFEAKHAIESSENYTGPALVYEGTLSVKTVEQNFKLDFDDEQDPLRKIKVCACSVC